MNFDDLVPDNADENENLLAREYVSFTDGVPYLLEITAAEGTSNYGFEQIQLKVTSLPDNTPMGSVWVRTPVATPGSSEEASLAANGTDEESKKLRNSRRMNAQEFADFLRAVGGKFHAYDKDRGGKKTVFRDHDGNVLTADEVKAIDSRLSAGAVAIVKAGQPAFDTLVGKRVYYKKTLNVKSGKSYGNWYTAKDLGL